MSTRAVYSFYDDLETFHVYGHCDGYPEGAYEKIKASVCLAWGLPRFEASDFAAAFVAANKSGAGGIYLTRGHGSHGDLNYRYVITNDNNKLRISVIKISKDDSATIDEEKIFMGSLDELREFIEIC